MSLPPIKAPSALPATLPTPRTDQVAIYERCSGATGAYKFFGICYPADGGRAITRFGDDKARLEKEIIAVRDSVDGC